jgi:hypothetical protein
MYDEPAVQMMGMTAADFNRLNDKKRITASSGILDRLVFVTMYIPNKHPTMYTQFILKSATFIDHE